MKKNLNRSNFCFFRLKVAQVTKKFKLRASLNEAILGVLNRVGLCRVLVVAVNLLSSGSADYRLSTSIGMPS